MCISRRGGSASLINGWRCAAGNAILLLVPRPPQQGPGGPPNKDTIIADRIRGDVNFNTEALGDFVILRCNTLSVYNVIQTA